MRKAKQLAVAGMISLMLMSAAAVGIAAGSGAFAPAPGKVSAETAQVAPVKTGTCAVCGKPVYVLDSPEKLAYVMAATSTPTPGGGGYSN